MLKKIIKKRAYEGNKIEDNLLFVTLQTQIVGLDMNNGYEQIFLSDKLSNMCNFYYDKDTKQLLVYNTSVLHFHCPEVCAITFFRFHTH